MPLKITFFESHSNSQGYPVIDSKNGVWEVELCSEDYKNLPVFIEEFLGRFIYVQGEENKVENGKQEEEEQLWE